MKRIETDALGDLAGPEGSLTFRLSGFGEQFGPIAVAWPESTEVASRLVAYAHERGAKVMAVGGGASISTRHEPIGTGTSLSTRHEPIGGGTGPSSRHEPLDADGRTEPARPHGGSLAEIEIEDSSPTSSRTNLARTIGSAIAATNIAPDLVISTQRLSRILEHSPADLVIRSECGLPFGALQDYLSPHRQHVPLDPMFPFASARPSGTTDSTVGGVLATNAFGCRRLRTGTARDWVLGTRLIRFDGAVVQSGGRVVKNVSGYDLNKLYLGSMGAFGILVDAFFKLEPLPRMRGVLTASGASSNEREKSVGLVRRWLDEPWPLAWTLFSREPGGASTLRAGFEGMPEVVATRGDRLKDLAREANFHDVSWELDSASSDVPPSRHDESLGPESLAMSGSLIVRLHHLPAEHLAFDRHAWDVASEAWSTASERTLLGSGISWLQWPAETLRSRPEAAWREDLVHLRRAAVSLGGHLVVERTPRGWLADLPRLDMPDDPRRMMVRLLRTLDPSGTFLPGLFPREMRGALL